MTYEYFDNNLLILGNVVTKLHEKLTFGPIFHQLKLKGNINKFKVLRVHMWEE
jgi:hypothetical protein